MPMTLLCWVYTARARSIMEYGADRCSPKWTIASGLKAWTAPPRNSKSVTSPTSSWTSLPDTSPHVLTRSCGEAMGVSVSRPSWVS